MLEVFNTAPIESSGVLWEGTDIEENETRMAGDSFKREGYGQVTRQNPNKKKKGRKQ